MEALVNVDSSLICARIIQVFTGAFFFFILPKQLDQRTKPDGLKDV